MPVSRHRKNIDDAVADTALAHHRVEVAFAGAKHDLIRTHGAYGVVPHVIDNFGLLKVGWQVTKFRNPFQFPQNLTAEGRRIREKGVVQPNAWLYNELRQSVSVWSNPRRRGGV